MSSKLLNFRFKLQCRNVLSVSMREKSVWSNDNVVKSPFEDIEIPKLTCDEYTWKNLDKWATKTAVVCGVTNRSYTYEEIYKKSRIFAANLRKKFKVKDGDVISIMLPNTPEYPLAIFGVLAAGGIASTLNPIYTAYETQRLLELSEATIIITNGDIVPVVKEALAQAKKNIPVISADFDHKLPDGAVSFKELIDDTNVDLDILKSVKRSHEDVAFLPFSSGTTGLPKGVQLTNRNMISNSAQQDTELRQYEYTSANHQDGILSILPMFHSYGLSICLLHKLSIGGKQITLPKFQPDTFTNAILKHKIHLMYLAPPMVLFMGAHPQLSWKHLEHVRTITSGAAPLPLADVQRLLDKAKHEINFVQGYGMTEASPLVTLGTSGSKQYESVGYALPNVELRIVDANTNSLGPNEVGELLIKGPNIMKGYLKNATANSEVFVDGDWMRSGDLGKIDETGMLTIADRLKELIKVKGYQVPPAELENVLKEHSDILDVAVVGIPDDAAGEKPKAFVVLKQGSKVTDKEIMDFVSERVAPYKKIKEVTFLEEIPKNPSGKILRKVIKEKYC